MAPVVQKKTQKKQKQKKNKHNNNKKPKNRKEIPRLASVTLSAHDVGIRQAISSFGLSKFKKKKKSFRKFVIF